MPKILETSKQCAHCMKTFHPTRADALYCRHACKRAAERKRAARLTPAPTTEPRFVPVVPIRSDGAITLAELRANPQLNPLLAAWDRLDTLARRVIDYAEKHMSAEMLAKAALGQEKINEGFLLLDEVSRAVN